MNVILVAFDNELILVHGLNKERDKKVWSSQAICLVILTSIYPSSLFSLFKLFNKSVNERPIFLIACIWCKLRKPIFKDMSNERYMPWCYIKQILNFESCILHFICHKMFCNPDPLRLIDLTTIYLRVLIWSIKQNTFDHCFQVERFQYDIGGMTLSFVM